MAPTKAALSIDEFSERYGVGKTTTYEEIKAGRLKAVKVGRRTLIPERSGDEWLASLPTIDPLTST